MWRLLTASSAPLATWRLAPIATWHTSPPHPLPTWQIVSLVLSCFAWLWLLVGFGVFIDQCLPTDEIDFDGGIDLNFSPVTHHATMRSG